VYPLPTIPYTNSQVRKQTEEFLAKLESALGIKTTVVDLEKQWDQDDPSGTGRKLTDYMSKVRFT
jgi:hypothetical protein